MIGYEVPLIDTNVLVFAHDEKSPKNAVAKDLLEKALNGDIKAVVAQQNLLEFVSVITNPKKVSETASLEEALRELDKYLSSELFVISPNERTILVTKALLRLQSLTGRRVFDVYLAATMISNGLNTIYTDNEKDFTIFKEIKVINPFKS